MVMSVSDWPENGEACEGAGAGLSPATKGGGGESPEPTPAAHAAHVAGAGEVLSRRDAMVTSLYHPNGLRHGVVGDPRTGFDRRNNLPDETLQPSILGHVVGDVLLELQPAARFLDP